MYRMCESERLNQHDMSMQRLDSHSMYRFGSFDPFAIMRMFTFFQWYTSLFGVCLDVTNIHINEYVYACVYVFCVSNRILYSYYRNKRSESRIIPIRKKLNISGQTESKVLKAIISILCTQFIKRFCFVTRVQIMIKICKNEHFICLQQIYQSICRKSIGILKNK